MGLEKSTSSEKGQETKLQQVDTVEIQLTQDSVEHSQKLQKINDILDVLDFPDKKEEEYRSFLLGQGEQFLQEAGNKSKSKSERLLFLVQARVDVLKVKGLRNLSKAERLQFLKLRKQLAESDDQELEKQQETVTTEKSKIQQNENLIATEKLKVEENSVTIATEQTETADITKTDQKLAELRGAIVENSVLRNSSTINIFEGLFAELNNVDRQNEAGKRGILQDIINKLKSPGTLESIATDLGGTETQAYREFKSQLLSIEPNLQTRFDKAEINMAGSLAKLKLGTDTLDGVNLEDDTLIQTNGDFVVEAGKDQRNVSLVKSNYTLRSQLDPDYERQLHQVSREATDLLMPINAQLEKLSAVLTYIQQAKDSNQSFEETKAYLKTNSPELYNELWVETKTSFDDMISILNQQKSDLNKSKKAIQDKAKESFDTLIAKNTAEAKEKDKSIEAMLRFFHAIGVDVINQNKLNTLIATVNMNPQHYGLQQAIDFENGSLGFNHDLGNKAISPSEKRSFIQFFNNMLGEPIVDENIAFGMTALSWQTKMKLQAVNNQPVGFFMENLNNQNR